MGLRVIWSYAAVDDLEGAAEYLHRDSPSFSSSFVLRALEAGRSLSDFPERGRVVPELKNDNIREIFLYSYRLIYRVEKDKVSILGLIHGRRDFSAVWQEQERQGES
jgi:plasmid stabilization system protein ParE